MNLINLRAGQLACAGCGVAIDDPNTVEEITTSFGVVLVTTLSRCASCVERVRAAEAAARAHPAVVGRLGSIEYAVAVIEATLGAFDALGFAPDEAQAMIDTDRLMGLAVRHLPRAGSAARWSARFAPTAVFGADPATASAWRWSHLSWQESEALREAFAAFLAARIDGPLQVEPPEDGVRGCLLCGVGLLTELRSRASKAWGSLWFAEAHTMGGQPRAESTPGYLCPDCRKATESVGSLGPTAAEEALMIHLGVRMRIGGVQLPPFRAWVALPEGTSPNAIPWAHLKGLDRLRARLELANRGPYRD